MRDRVLFIWGHLRSRPGLAFWLEERVIAKAVVPTRLAQEAALPAALGHVFGAIGSHERADGDESGGAALIGDIGHLRQDQVIIGLVIAMLAGPAGGKYAGHAVELFDGQAGIIRDGSKAGRSRASAGLDERVIGEGAAVFHRLWVGLHGG